MASSSSFLIASEQNKLSITTLFVFYSTSTKAQHCTWTRNHELTAHVVDTDALLYMCHFSSEKCSHNKMKEILFEVCTFFKSSMFCMSWHIIHAVFQSKTVGYAHSPNSLALSSQFSSVLILDLKHIADEVKATTVVLQGQQPRHSNSTLSNRALLPFAYQWAQQRNKAWQKIIQRL